MPATAWKTGGANPSRSEGVILRELQVCNPQANSAQVAQREKLCEQVVTHSLFSVHQGHQLECTCPKFALGETACDWPSESLDFTGAAWQGSSRSICETMKEGLKRKQSKEQFYSVPSTASYLHTRRSQITRRIPFSSLGTHLGGFDHQRDRLKEKVIFCSACIYTQLNFTYGQAQRQCTLRVFCKHWGSRL